MWERLFLLQLWLPVSVLHHISTLPPSPPPSTLCSQQACGSSLRSVLLANSKRGQAERGQGRQLAVGLCSTINRFSSEMLEYYCVSPLDGGAIKVMPHVWTEHANSIVRISQTFSPSSISFYFFCIYITEFLIGDCVSGVFPHCCVDMKPKTIFHNLDNKVT